MEITDLRSKLSQMPPGPEADGLRTFIRLAEDLPGDVTIMGKIQRRFVDRETLSRIRGAESLEEIQSAFGDKYRVSIEEV